MTVGTNTACRDGLAAAAARAVARCRALAAPPFSDSPGMLFRAFLTPGHIATCIRLRDWMQEAGMSVRTDQAGNLVGRYAGSRDGPALLIGSHID
ncbi:MAG: hypothetical protein EON93_07985, partial [Burkholderiales bacterium]